MMLNLVVATLGLLCSDSKFGVDGVARDFQWYRQYNGDYAYPPATDKRKFWTVGKIDANPLVPWTGTFSSSLSHLRTIFAAEKGHIRNLVDAARNAGEGEIHISIGNEPNVYPYLTPSDYAQAYKMYYDYIKGAGEGQLDCQQCVVHNGAILLVRLTPSNTSLASLLIKASGQNVKNYEDWTRQFLSSLASLGGKVDMFNVHLYDANLKVLEIKGAGIANDLIAGALGSWRTDPLVAYPRFFGIVQSFGYTTPRVWVDEFGIMDNSAGTDSKIASMTRMVNYFQSRPEIRKWFWYKVAGTDDKLSGTSPFLKTLGIRTALDPTPTGLYESEATDAPLTPLGQAYLDLRRKYDPSLGAIHGLLLDE